MHRAGGRQVHQRADSDGRDEPPVSGRGYAIGAVAALLPRGQRRDQRVPVRPGLARGRAVRPGPEARARSLRRQRRLPARRGDFDRGVLRDLPARGAGHGPAAAAAAGDVLGGVRAGRASTRRRCAAAAPASSSGVMYHDYGARLAAAPTGSRATSAPAARGSVASGRVAYTLRPGGPGGHRGHGVLVVAGGAAPGGAGAAAGRVRRWRWPAA